MKLLIAVKSCHSDMYRGDHEVIRNTWGKDAGELGIDVRFFVGGRSESEVSLPCSMWDASDDVVALDVEDNYHNLPYKTREICRWATDYDHIFICDTDTCVWPKKLLACDFEGYDYVGKVSLPFGRTFRYDAIDRDLKHEIHEQCHPWASGGYGYFLSRRAADVVANETPTSWAEDLWIGQVMGSLIAQSKMTGADRGAGTYSDHLSSPKYGNYDAKLHWWMKQTYEAKR